MQHGQELKVILSDSVLRAVWSRQLDPSNVEQWAFNVKFEMWNLKCEIWNVEHNVKPLFDLNDVQNAMWNVQLGVMCKTQFWMYNGERNVQPNVQHNMERKLEPTAKSRVCAYWQD